VREFTVKTSIGTARAFAYKTKFEDAEHLALVFGRIERERAVAVRIHREKLVEDIFGPQGDYPLRLLEVALQRIQHLGGGVVIYLRSGFVGVPLDTLTNPEAPSRADARRAEWLEIGVGAQILRDLGVERIRIIAGREVDYVGVAGFGLTLDGTELLVD
jgi:3,4-dihydroxy 2-butanone 4-phosphate synthase/GTP cyclohydrolase II